MVIIDDALAVLISGIGDGGLQAIAMIEDMVTDIDAADQFTAIISAVIVLVLFICSIVCWGTSAPRR
jgi:hypothetical protein